MSLFVVHRVRLPKSAHRGIAVALLSWSGQQLCVVLRGPLPLRLDNQVIDAAANARTRNAMIHATQRDYAASYARHGSTRIFVCRLGFANSAKAPATSPMPTLPVTMGDTFTAPLAINSRALVNSAVVHANTYCSDSSLKHAYMGICRSASMQTRRRPRVPIGARPR